MSDTIVPIGKTVALSTTTTVAVANVAVGTNAFHITNASSSVYAYVGVFKSYDEAAAMDHPSTGTDGFGTIIVPNGSEIIAGNFGINPNPDTVYVASITATGSTSVFATPIAP